MLHKANEQSNESNPSKEHVSKTAMPSLAMLGSDLIETSPLQCLTTLSAPFVSAMIYFIFAARGWWPPALFALMHLSFVTYGSTSHDLVHRNLGLSRKANDLFLCLIELLTLRSGHAYRLAHLHHHSRYPNHDDIEGRAAHLSLFGALLDGLTLQPRVWLWSLSHVKTGRTWIIGEGIACLALGGISLLLLPFTTLPLIYVVLVVMGSWIIPLITSYIPHSPDGSSPLFQTRLFRGRILSLIAMEHLYHLEHHLYPEVPHHHWPELARRLDPAFIAAGVQPIVLWF